MLVWVTFNYAAVPPSTNLQTSVVIPTKLVVLFCPGSMSRSYVYDVRSFAGWLVKLKLSHPSEFDELMTVKDYEQHVVESAV